MDRGAPRIERAAVLAYASSRFKRAGDEMQHRVTIIAAAVIAAASPAARAAEAPALPTLALQPAPSPSPWNGLSVGTEVFGVSGGHGVKGGFGAAATADYAHAFANTIVLGVGGAAGYTPGLFAGAGIRGFDFAQADVKLGYDMGRVLPYVTGGVALLKPVLRPGSGLPGPGDAFNDLVNGTANLKAAATVGAGVDYAVTNNLTVGLAVSVTQVPAPAVP